MTQRTGAARHRICRSALPFGSPPAVVSVALVIHKRKLKSMQREANQERKPDTTLRRDRAIKLVRFE